MHARFAAALIAAALSTAAAADAEGDRAYWRNVESSFTHMLNHAPYYGPTAVTVRRGEKDPVERALHWREPGAPQVVGPAAPPAGDADPVRASFDRMLHHAPYAGPTAVTVERGRPDPVERLVLEALRDVRAPVRVVWRSE